MNFWIECYSHQRFSESCKTQKRTLIQQPYFTREIDRALFTSTSHHITSDHITWHHKTSYHNTPHHISWHHITYRITRHHITITSHDTTSHIHIPHHTSHDHISHHTRKRVAHHITSHHSTYISHHITSFSFGSPQSSVNQFNRLDFEVTLQTSWTTKAWSTGC